MKKIIINVDDLGLSPAINSAVIGLANKKIITSTSFMSHGNIHFEEVLELKAMQIDIGLHFDLTGICKEGGLKEIILKSYLGKWQLEKIKSIISNQLDEFENKIDSIPRFIDGHQHVHQLPQIREMLVDTIFKRYGDKISWRNTRPQISEMKANIIYQLGGKKFHRILKNNNLTSNVVFSGVYNFNLTFEKLFKKWDQWLKKAPKDGLLIMCHPAMPSNLWHDEIKQARELEWYFFNSESFNELLIKNSCVVVNWSERVFPDHTS